MALALGRWVTAQLTDLIYIDSSTGPADIAGTWGETQRALAHGILIYAAGVVLARWAARSPRKASAALLIVLTADLMVSNSRLIWTVPQAEFESVPEVARRIEEAEREQPSAGPFRGLPSRVLAPVSRFLKDRLPDRHRELLAWERGTLESLHLLPQDLEICHSPTGSMEVDDYIEFFRSGKVPAPSKANYPGPETRAG